MEQDFLLRRNGTEQKQYIFDAQLLEQHADTGAGHRQGGRQRWLKSLFIAGTDGESHLWSAGRWYLRVFTGNMINLSVFLCQIEGTFRIPAYSA